MYPHVERELPRSMRRRHASGSLEFTAPARADGCAPEPHLIADFWLVKSSGAAARTAAPRRPPAPQQPRARHASPINAARRRPMADAPTAEEMAAAAAALGAVGAGGTKRPRSPLDDEEEEEDDESVEGPSLSELEAAADSAMYSEQTKICQAVKVESGAPVIYPYHRVRRIMKAEDQVQALLEKRQPLALGREAPRVMAKACELFTRSLSARAWAGAHRKGRKCLRRRDVGNAIVRHSEFDFLIDVRPTAEDGAQDIA